MQTTTPQAIHQHFVGVIHGITPSYSYLSDVRWGYVVELPGAVSGPQIRRYTMDWGVAEFVPDGLFSTGEEFAAMLEIHVAYGRLPKEHAPWLATQDGVDLRTVLLAQLAPTCPGLLSVLPQGYEPYSDEQGRWYGRHIYEIHWMHHTQVSLPPVV